MASWTLPSFSSLTARERLLLLLTGLTLLILLVYLVLLAPYQHYRHQLDQRIASRAHQLQQLDGLRQEYLQLQQQLQRLQQPPAEFSLFSFVEGQISQIAGRENLTAMRPLTPVQLDGLIQEAVEVKLERVRLDQIVQLLVQIEQAPAPLRVTALNLQSRFDAADLLDSRLLIAAYRQE
ncbi:type II secretion system protein GspM [Desulfuromonas thiophila]|jgi:general secretion pathway protein M|uniref:General secretion pathway protein M n=1 Tax=Desulfuromonas thiophila TaxID=57664 RepID=A0A1G6XX21_9BACT|nr:type II secretion system protein GspM [Desulfuromonas thiophila]MDD3800982.1 type II secretion system protein GspM [Desulfuromonas thiophila]SDD81926.1 general secretion pathway protein M [Desulfuromonas thiophila]